LDSGLKECKTERIQDQQQTIFRIIILNLIQFVLRQHFYVSGVGQTRDLREGAELGEEAQRGARTSIKSQFCKILITFGDKCPQNGEVPRGRILSESTLHDSIQG